MRRRISAAPEAVPWQRADLDTLGLSEAACRESVQYRDAVGHWHSGGRAVAAILRDARLPWSALGWLASVPGLAWLVDRAYVLVSNNRYRLPGGTPACQLSDHGRTSQRER